ncbi:MAG: hypothetical protein R3263_12100, partial [Myxococcota bacterium]|nr:hypothetical protein [Myxococcota bacterium]
EATAPAARVLPDREGPGMHFESVDGLGARFRSRVSMTSPGRFDEEGTIDLGEGAVLRFETEGEGCVGPSEEPGMQRGGVVWRIVGGEGALAGARGVVTSNFTLGQDGALVDHQLGVLELP